MPLTAAIYVGDETRDVEAARKAGVQIIAVGWGLNSRASLLLQNPDFIVDSPEELTQLFPVQILSSGGEKK